MKTLHWLWFTLGLTCTGHVHAADTPAPTEKPENKAAYILATATTGGTYYPVGVAIATLTKVKLEPKTGISLSAISSAGSGENIKLLRENQAQFAILQALYGAWAWAGEGALVSEGAQKNLRTITMLWQNVEHFTVNKKFIKTGTIEDLSNFAGAKFSIGSRNSGTEGSGRHILTALGIDPETLFDVTYQGYGPSADALQNGVISGMNTPAGVPVSAVSRAFANIGEELAILNFTEEQLTKVNAKYPIWSMYNIPAETYPKQMDAVTTIAQPNILTVRDDIPEEEVYQVVKTIYDNLAFLQGIHKATSVMSLEKAIEGLPIPLHAGAIRFYEEQGVTIPNELKTKSAEQEAESAPKAETKQ